MVSELCSRFYKTSFFSLGDQIPNYYTLITVLLRKVKSLKFAVVLKGPMLQGSFWQEAWVVSGKPCYMCDGTGFHSDRALARSKEQNRMGQGICPPLP